MKPLMMIRTLFVGLALSLLPAVIAANVAPSQAEWISLDGQPVAGGNRVEADGIIRQYQGPVIRLMRSAAPAPKGTILLFPGGGYSILSAIAEGSKTAEFLNQNGFDVGILEYRVGKVATIREQALEDALTSWRLITANSQALGLHVDRLGIMGYSAGGHLSARTAQALAKSSTERQPDDLILVYPAYLNECPAGSVWPAVQPPAAPKGRLFLLVAANDRAEWCSSSTVYAKAWKGYDGQASFHLLPDGGHGFGMGDKRSGAAKNWPELLKDFFDARPEVSAAENPAAVPVQKSNPRHEQKVAAVAKAKFDLIMIGDSITNNLEKEEYLPVWQQFFAPRQALNLGYSGYRTENILWNLQNGELAGQSPKVITLMIGTNNIDEAHYPTRHTAGQVAGGTQAIVALIREKCPNTKILLLRPFPGSYDGPLPTSHRMILERTGDLIKALADDQHVFYCDVNAVFLNPDGSINKKLMPDYLHPSPEGARLWAEAMEPMLCKLMGDQSLYNSAVASVSRLENDGYDWMGRHTAILAVKDALNTWQISLKPDVVLIGDSITHAWGGVPSAGARKTGEKVLTTSLSGHRVLNLGFGWDRLRTSSGALIMANSINSNPSSSFCLSAPTIPVAPSMPAKTLRRRSPLASALSVGEFNRKHPRRRLSSWPYSRGRKSRIIPAACKLMRSTSASPSSVNSPASPS